MLDSDGLLRVGRENNSDLSYQTMHPLGKHTITKVIVRSEHLCMLHAGTTLLCSTLANRFHIFYMHCQRKPQSQLLGQLPLERITPCFVFQNPIPQD